MEVSWTQFKIIIIIYSVLYLTNVIRVDVLLYTDYCTFSEMLVQRWLLFFYWNTPTHPTIPTDHCLTMEISDLHNIQWLQIRSIICLSGGTEAISARFFYISFSVGLIHTTNVSSGIQCSNKLILHNLGFSFMRWP